MNTASLLAVTALLAAAAVPAQAQRLAPATRAAVTLASPERLNLGAWVRFGGREFQTSQDVLECDQTHYVLRLGFRALDFAHLWAELGMSEARTRRDEGEMGLEAAAGAGLRLLELVLAGNDIEPRKECLAIEFDASFRTVESNFGDRDFHYQELRLSPAVVYSLSREDEARWRRFDPVGADFRLGAVFAQADGEFGDETIEQNHDFGAQLGGGLLLPGGWTLALDAVLFGGADREFAVGFSRIF